MENLYWFSLVLKPGINHPTKLFSRVIAWWAQMWSGFIFKSCELSIGHCYIFEQISLVSSRLRNKSFHIFFIFHRFGNVFHILTWLTDHPFALICSYHLQMFFGLFYSRCIALKAWYGFNCLFISRGHLSFGHKGYVSTRHFKAGAPFFNTPAKNLLTPHHTKEVDRFVKACSICINFLEKRWFSFDCISCFVGFCFKMLLVKDLSVSTFFTPDGGNCSKLSIRLGIFEPSNSCSYKWRNSSRQP